MGKLTITNTGNVSFEWDDKALSNVYTFVHDMQEPHCNHFDNEHHVETNHEEDKASFEKEYTSYNCSIKLNHEVKITPSGFSWDITRLVESDQFISCRYGITLPVDCLAIEGVDGIIDVPLANYQQEWRSDFEGQLNLDLPIIKVFISKKPAYIQLPFTESVQFFIFEDNGKKFLKISTLNGCDVQLSIAMSFNTNEPFLESYCRHFPGSQSYVYRYETLKEKIQSKFGIKILSHQSLTQGYDVQPPTNEELEKYIVILEENLNFYPKDFFKWLGLKTISICGHLITDNKICGGLLVRTSMLFNASAKLGPIFQAKAIHHELFHMIEKKLPLSKQRELRQMWDEFPDRDSFSMHFAGKPLADPMEYRAELFATFILDPAFIRDMDDPSVKKKFQMVASIFSGISTECAERITTHCPQTENTLTRMNEPPAKNEPIPERQWQFCGIKHSCFRDLNIEGIEICSPDDVPNGDVAYITLNPLDYCAIEYVHHGIPIEKSFKTWINIHTKLEQANSACHLKTEDVLKADLTTIKQFWKGVGLDFNVEKIWGIEDKLRTVPLSSIPMLKNAWGFFRDSSIVVRLGYNNMPFED